MNIAKKILISFLVLVFVFCMAGIFVTNVAFAAGTTAPQAASDIQGYYGSQLKDPIQIAFYKALGKMDFTKGDDSVEVSCDGIEALAMKYTQGNNELLKKFGAARDCFYYDNAELFYVDIDYVTLGIVLKNGNYVVSIGSGRSDTYFRKGVTAENVKSMIDIYNEQMDSFVSQIETKIAWANKNWSTAVDASDIATFINDAVCSRITYGFCATDNGEDTANAPFIRTSYGALVVRESVCEGYARLYKAVCDRFGIPCVLIYGDYVHSNGGVEPHMWTAVKIGDDWLANDPTFNDRNVESSRNKYLLVTGTYLEADHFANPIISTSDYELGYPVLKTKSVNMPSGLLQARYMVPAGKTDILLAVSYLDMNAKDLASQMGLYLAWRVEYDGAGWGPWTSFLSAESTYISLQIKHMANYTQFAVGANNKVSNYEIAVFDIVDDEGLVGLSGYRSNYSAKAVAEHMIEQSNSFENDSYDPYYVAPVYVKSVAYSYTKDGKNVSGTDFQTSMQDLGHEYKLTVKYAQALVKKDADKDVSVSYEIKFPVGDVRDIDPESVYENCKLSDVQWNGSDTLTFTFMPSPLFQHNRIYYTFAVENLVNQPVGDKQVAVAPTTFGALFGYTDTYICTKCLGGGRYLIDNAYAQPALVDDSDLSTKGWTYKDEDGVTHKVSESQRSNIALVVNTPTGQVADSIAENLESIVGATGATDYKSQTYEVDLQICGAIASIPNGSYLKIKLGYPAGYNYDSMAAGTTFKLYHFKRNSDGSLDYAHPEEIECVFTEYGIVALVESFSPYTIVALEGVTQAQDSRSLTTQFNGLGGELKSNADKPIVSLKSGETVTYTLNPYTGYEIEYALLNGAPVTVVDGGIDISFADLPDTKAASVLSVGFVASTVKQSEEADTTVTNLSLAYVANTVVADSVVIGDTASNAEVLAAVNGVAESISESITGEAQTVEQPALVTATNPTVLFIEFDTDGGNEIATIFEVADALIILPENPTKAGYNFVGWTLDGATYSFPEANDNGEIAMPSTSLKLVAVWSSEGHVSITFNTDGGSAVATIFAKAGDSIVAPKNPTKEGYEFKGWQTSDGKAYTIPATMPSENVVLTAVWEKVQPTYTITFNSDGGSAVATISAKSGEVITAPQNPTKEGYEFKGWQTSDGKLYSIPATMPAGNVALTAVWEKIAVKQSTITFDSNGGSAVAKITADVNSAINAPADPTRKGYTFKGWQTSNGIEYEIPATMPDEDVVLFASWQANEYTITFDSNGGSKVASITAKTDEEITPPTNPTKEGYVFNGWLKDGKRYNFPEKMPASDLKLTASWKAENVEAPKSGNTTLFIVLGIEVVVILVAIVVVIMLKKRKNS